jgi:hypothetical protein
MRIFVLTVNYQLRVSRKSHLRDHPNSYNAVLTTNILLLLIRYDPRYAMMYNCYEQMCAVTNMNSL